MEDGISKHPRNQFQSLVMISRTTLSLAVALEASSQSSWRFSSSNDHRVATRRCNVIVGSGRNLWWKWFGLTTTSWELQNLIITIGRDCHHRTFARFQLSPRLHLRVFLHDAHRELLHAGAMSRAWLKPDSIPSKLINWRLLDMAIASGALMDHQIYQKPWLGPGWVTHSHACFHKFKCWRIYV